MNHGIYIEAFDPPGVAFSPMPASLPAIEDASLHAALRLAQEGYRVFPCNPRTKAPLLRATAEGGWKEQASTDPKRIRHWWHRFPDAMIGLPTGANINAVVLDIDAETPAELQALRQAVEAAIGEPLPATWATFTPRGGQHLFFALPLGTMVGNSRGALPRDVDVRGEGGYVIAAPSIRSDGRMYGWAVSPGQTAMAAAPAKLLRCILNLTNQIGETASEYVRA